MIENENIENNSLAIQKLASDFEINEIHLINSKGVLYGGSVPGFFGFDFNTSEQTKPFLNILDNHEIELSQDPQPRGTDKTLFSYTGVYYKPVGGVIQIGMYPKEYEELLKANSISNHLNLSSESYLFLVNKEGIIIEHPEQSKIGESITKYDWGKEILKKSSGEFFYKDNGIKNSVYLRSK